jgi:hypothetical protein
MHQALCQPFVPTTSLFPAHRLAGHHLETSLNKTKKEAAGLGMPAKKENGREADVSIGILFLGGLNNGET